MVVSGPTPQKVECGPLDVGTIGGVEVTMDEFHALVAKAVERIPEPFSDALDEVAVVVEEHGPPEMNPLFGLYQGVPRTHGRQPSGLPPPHISIYRRPLIDVCHTEEELVEQVRITVLHELGHHLGMDEDQLDELGYA